jgi:hypothetical protein
MGHERVGTLPRTLSWRRVVERIGSFAEPDAVAGIAAATLDNVRGRFDGMHRDPGVHAAFEFLVGLSATGGSSGEGKEWDDLALDATTVASPLLLSRALRDWVSAHTGSLEYGTLAQAAATDAIAIWSRQHRQQTGLFDSNESGGTVWRNAATGAGFCELSRLFFGKYTERYLSYFLQREASAVLGSLEARDRFADGIRHHVDSVSRHAFETAKITQSFAAGWFNRNARRGRPSHADVQRFLATAFGKVREELFREGRHA